MAHMLCNSNCNNLCCNYFFNQPKFTERSDELPRNGRRKSSSDFYHVIIRGINRERIFETNRHKEKLTKYLKEREVETVEIYAYCIMSNHLHLLLHGPLKEISEYMKAVQTAYALYYNRKMERNGHVFQNRFKSFPIESEEYLWQCFYYIHLNPVKAKITGKMNRYQYSSAQEYIYEKKGLIRENARQFIKSGQMTYSAERVIPQLEEVYIEDLPEDTKEQKERIFRKWIEIYLEEHPDLQFWDLQKLPENRKDFAETMLDPRVMSRKELLRRLDKFRQ